MINLNSDDVKLIHAELEKKFPMMLKRISKEGLIESAIEKQSGKLYGTERYDSVYKKAAALMEAITRWHIFHDGNKRTGLLCAFLYLYVNQYYTDDQKFVRSVTYFLLVNFKRSSLNLTVL